MNPCFTEEDMPGSYHDADCASIKAQRLYLASFRYMLIATILAATSSWLASVFHTYRTVFNGIALVLATAAFVATFILKERKFEDTWYLGRAVAESIKTRSWKYMMNAEPYGSDLSSALADVALIGDVRAILEDNDSLILERAPNKSREEISQNMRALRAASLQTRLQTYLQCRIIDQRDWYGTKASVNATSESHLFIAVLLCQFFASAVALVGLLRDWGVSDIIGIFAASSAAFLAWLQVKKYQETAKAYSVASHDLSMAAALLRNVTDEAEMSRFVSESESAISREHTLWMARRTSRN